MDTSQHFRIAKEPIDAKQLELSLINAAAGALATFSGFVRDNNEGQSVLTLEYEAYEGLAVKEAKKILAEAKDRFDILSAVCEHRVGLLEIGDMAVFVGVTAAHRGAAFDACRFIIDEIKLRLPVWKKETYSSGDSGWVNCSHHEKHRSSEIEITENAFYSRQSMLTEFGIAGQKKLTSSRVLVVGAGGLGCPALQHLAGAGVGHIAICDDDNVSVNNLHRQNLFSIQDIGANKAITAKSKLQGINPFIELIPLPLRVTEANANETIANYDVVLDCSDNLQTKFILADACKSQNVALLQASIYQYEGQLLLWHKHIGQCFRCLWSEESAITTNGKDCVDNCAESGITGAVAGIVGSLQALECIKFLIGMPSVLSENILLVDLHSMQTRAIKIKHDQNCPNCKVTILTETAVNANNDRKTEEISASDLCVKLEDLFKASTNKNMKFFDIRELVEQKSEPIGQDLVVRLAAQSNQIDVFESLPVSQINFEALSFDPSIDYVFACQKGLRSLKLVRQLRQRGFINTWSLAHGLASMTAQLNETSTR